MSYNRKVVLNRDEIKQCMNFSKRFAAPKAQKSSKDFGSLNAPERGGKDKTSDTMTGKLAEYAFMKFCKANGVDITIDFEITDGILNIDDGQDITTVDSQINTIKCDIKGAKSYAKWLLIESHKIDEKIIFAHIYIFVKVTIPSGVEKDLNLYNVNKIKTEIAGYALSSDFCDIDRKPWFMFRQDSAPFTPDFVDILFNKAKGYVLHNDVLRKSHFKDAYLDLESNDLLDNHVLNMTQKAAINLSLPVQFLRNSDEDIKALFSALQNQNLSLITKTSIWE